MSHHLVGVAEIAAMLGVSRQRVNQLVAEDADFPAPEAELSAGRVWLRESVEAWIASNPAQQKSGASRDAVARMSERFSPDIRRAIAYAGEEAARGESEAIEPEHLLAGLVRVGGDNPAAEVIKALGLELEDVRALYTLPRMDRRTDQLRVGRFSRRTAAVLEHAFRHAHFRSQQKLTSIHVLLAMLSASPGVFESLGVDLGQREDATVSLWNVYGPRLAEALSRSVPTARATTPGVRMTGGPVLRRVKNKPADIARALDEIRTRLTAIERRLGEV
jgi:ATP-dependent Clp protease ATP-binding subunit ClpA/predicted DNA-binding transcriptional regulator AlpA